MPDHKTLPVPGYTDQSAERVALVTQNKRLEEMVLRQLDSMRNNDPGVPVDIDQRWLAIGRTHLEQAFMAINRAVFQPQRVKLEGEE
jgi:hypothetical protein